MTAETDLLPCPWCGEKLASVSVSEGSTFSWRKVDGCCADGPEVRHNTMADDQEAAEVESRAAAIAAWNTRACIAHATAAKDAEVEALRAEVERLTFEMGCLRQQYDERTACMIVHRGSALACSAAVRAAYYEEHERAERLAEALRRCEAAAALEAAREDAERYRWLRDRMAAEEITDETYARLALRTVGPIAKRPADSDYCDELDAAIDQARGKGGGEVEGG